MLLEKIRSHLKVTPRNILIVTLMPIAFAALFIVVVWLSGLNRYDSAYFTGEYLKWYSTPGGTAQALAEALRTNDTELLAELQGLRQPREFVTSPDMALTVLYEITDIYYSYLYYDTRTYKRYPHHFEKVRGRWVAAPEDAYYFLRSGEWLKAFMPVSLTWWVVEVVFLVGYGVSRLARRWAADVFSYG